MLKVSLRNLVAHKLRLALTVAAITLGVAFVSGTFVLSDTMGKAFDELYAGLGKGTDVTVRAKSAYSDITSQGQTRPLDEDVVAAVRRVPGVASAEGSVTGFALVLDKQGTPIQPGGAPTLGAGMHTDRSLAAGFSLRSGVAPTQPDQVALDAATAAKAGYVPGDKARIVFEDGTGTFTVVGVVGFGEADSLAGATLATFEGRTAQRVLGKQGLVGQVDVRAADGVRTEDLRQRIAAAVPSGVEAVTSARCRTSHRGPSATVSASSPRSCSRSPRCRSWWDRLSSGTPSTSCLRSAVARSPCCARSVRPAARW